MALLEGLWFMSDASAGPLPFWLTSDRRGATAAALAKAEAHFGKSLPAELRELLMLQDGGISNYEAYEDGDDYFPLLPFLGVGRDRGDTIMDALAVRDTFGIPKQVIPLRPRATHGGDSIWSRARSVCCLPA